MLNKDAAYFRHACFHILGVIAVLKEEENSLTTELNLALNQVEHAVESAMNLTDDQLEVKP